VPTQKERNAFVYTNSTSFRNNQIDTFRLLPSAEKRKEKNG
jgi:hypothetical protein